MVQIALVSFRAPRRWGGRDWCTPNVVLSRAHHCGTQRGVAWLEPPPVFYDLVGYPRAGTHATKKEWINPVILLNGLELAGHKQ